MKEPFQEADRRPI